jgi:NAD-dependent dihydropyrimidine dehydrogenase PreA subunit
VGAVTRDAGQASYTVTDACTACGACLLTCPEQVRADRCTDCGECIEICPVDALRRTP